MCRCVVADRDDATVAPARRRRPDPAALLVGLFSLAVAGAAFLGRIPDLAVVADPRWLLAGAAVLLGVLLLVGSLRRRRDG